MGKILESIKYLLGGEALADDDIFDTELIIHINGALTIINQLGVGPPEGFKITGENETWEDFLQDRKDLELVKTTVYHRVRLSFDPPQNSFLVRAIEDQIKENDWRIEINHNMEV